MSPPPSTTCSRSCRRRSTSSSGAAAASDTQTQLVRPNSRAAPKGGAGSCRRIANLYFTLVAARSCTSISPIRCGGRRAAPAGRPLLADCITGSAARSRWAASAERSCTQHRRCAAWAPHAPGAMGRVQRRRLSQPQPQCAHAGQLAHQRLAKRTHQSAEQGDAQTQAAAGPSGALRCARPRPGRPGWPLQRVRGAGPRRGRLARARARRPITTFLPLGIVLGVSIIKEALEDVRRHQADCAVNRRPCQVFSPAARAWQKRRWRDVKVRPWACASDLSAPAPASDRAVQPTMALALHGLGRLVTALGLQACLRIAKPSVVSGQCQGGGQKLAGCRAHGERQYASTRLVPGGSEQKGSEQLARIVTGWLAPWALPHAAGVSAPVAMGPAACCGACLHHRSASALLEAAGGRGRAGR